LSKERRKKMEGSNVRHFPLGEKKEEVQKHRIKEEKKRELASGRSGESGSL